MCVCVYKSNSIDPIHPPSWQTSPTHDTEIFFKALKSYRSVPRTCGAFWRPQTVRSITSGRQNVTPNQPTVILETRGFIFNSSWKKKQISNEIFPFAPFLIIDFPFPLHFQWGLAVEWGDVPWEGYFLALYKFKIPQEETKPAEKVDFYSFVLPALFSFSLLAYWIIDDERGTKAAPAVKCRDGGEPVRYALAWLRLHYSSTCACSTFVRPKRSLQHRRRSCCSTSRCIYITYY